MGFDFAVWAPTRRLSAREAGALFSRLCEGHFSDVEASPALLRFSEALARLHPEPDHVPREERDDPHRHPWSCAHSRSDGHLIVACVASRADAVRALLIALAAEHQLVVFDPQEARITYPDGSSDSAG